jgi:hypothetical protein
VTKKKFVRSTPVPGIETSRCGSSLGPASIGPSGRTASGGRPAGPESTATRPSGSVLAAPAAASSDFSTSRRDLTSSGKTVFARFDREG